MARGYRSLLLMLLRAAAALPQVMWSGGVTNSSAVIVVECTSPSCTVIASSSREDLSSTKQPPSKAAIVFSNQKNGVGKYPLSGLTPSTKYYYGVLGDDAHGHGVFTTFGDDPFSFSFAFSSCSEHGINPSVFKTIADRKDDLFFVHMGDMHYRDINTNSTKLYDDAYKAVHSESNQQLLYKSRPIMYTWDDHDYGNNNGNFYMPGRAAARESYRKYVPHYDLPAGGGDKAIYQAWTVGNVRFILTDLRSDSNNRANAPKNAPGVSGFMTMDGAQTAWLFNELSNAHLYSLVVWVSSKPFIGTTSLDLKTADVDDLDKWMDYPAERQILANHIADNDVQNLILIAGDAHMLAYDDGSHSDYSDKGGYGFPVFQASPLFRFGSVKGGPYTSDCVSYMYIPNSQYGVMNIDDDGVNPVCISFEGWKQETDTGTLSKAMDFKKCAPFNTKGKDPNKKVCTLSYAPLYIEICGALAVILFFVFVGYGVKRLCCFTAKSSKDICRNEIVVQRVSEASAGSSSHGPARSPVRSAEMIGLTVAHLQRKSDPVLIGENVISGGRL